MKKLIWIVMLICVALAVAGCGCGHRDTEVRGKIAATCSEEGYVGDTYCTGCGEMTNKGQALPKLAHTEGELEGVVEATCTAEGYTGDIKCTVCGEIVTVGETIAMLEHTPGEAEGAVEATCTEEGYTGDIKCTVCGEMVTAGEAVPVLEHVAGEAEGAVEATCTAEGYTGDVKCVACGEVLTVGEAVVGGHAYDDGACTKCGEAAPEAGLHAHGKLRYDWDTMVKYELVTVDEGELTWAKDTLDGTLVLPVGVYAVAEEFIENAELTIVITDME